MFLLFETDLETREVVHQSNWEQGSLVLCFGNEETLEQF